MSSPATQYVYIPNLVGRQMLRIPLDEVEAEGQINISSTAQNTTYSPPARNSSPSPSVSSIEEEKDDERCTDALHRETLHRNKPRDESVEKLYCHDIIPSSDC
ncbi:hypothetical protein HBI64_185720 [Parastagonospora nodorum]|nr:hypothetical protein HBH46_093800 [Parastagonospora nodorum]KAH4216110.1 hypothetical protein HBI06_236190 [Parastagonospora nodorum]KAH4232496.1 hypothetical protein HBI05_173430 [Parastagonospora nodorum]KAH4845758.1 hypothetical protein HBH75_177910 [Parastagonospora nodorum]KAH5172694.1 hypothetical protein HBH68_199360 [Parastagonospora nodorum]